MTIPTGNPGPSIDLDFSFTNDISDEAISMIDKWRDYLIEQQLAQRDNHILKCLQRWVSELEPCIKLDQNQNVVGLGIEGSSQVFVLNEELYSWANQLHSEL